MICLKRTAVLHHLDAFRIFYEKHSKTNSDFHNQLPKPIPELFFRFRGVIHTLYSTVLMDIFKNRNAKKFFKILLQFITVQPNHL